MCEKIMEIFRICFPLEPTLLLKKKENMQKAKNITIIKTTILAEFPRSACASGATYQRKLSKPNKLKILVNT